MNNNIFDFCEKMNEDNIILSFKGGITSELLTSILQIVVSKMETLNESSKVRKRVYSILVEVLQNLYHHMDEEKINLQDKYNDAIFILGRKEDFYVIHTGNYLKKDKVHALQKRLEKINSLDKDELKMYYKEVLNNGLMSDKGGGGLGMIDIARKSRHKLDFNFQDMDNTHSFFSLNIKIAQ